jgi:hypothetical protein
VYFAVVVRIRLISSVFLCENRDEELLLLFFKQTSGGGSDKVVGVANSCASETSSCVIEKLSVSVGRAW